MILAIITAAIAVLLIIGVALLAAWVDRRHESWYDKTLKHIWKDTKG